jgi:hypothetical protein
MAGPRGGDVSGTTRIDMSGGVGEAIEVATASFDPGYELGKSMGYANKADLKQGYQSFGKGIGESNRDEKEG